jgi:hypothetical protein
MAHQYLVRYSVKTNFKVNGINQFKFGPISVIVYNSPKKPEDKCKWPNICIFDILTTSDTIELAIEDSFNFVDGVLGLISLHIGTSSEIPIFEKAIDWDNGIHDRCFVQNSILPYLVGTPRGFDPKKFEILFSYLNRSDIPYRQVHSGRVERAIRWYRKGLAETDDISKHTFLWVGLEIINPLIKDKYLEKISSDPQKSYYRENKPSELISLVGIKFLLIERCNYSYNDWKSIKDTRDLIIHGSEPLSSIKQKVKQQIPLLEKALLKGIYEAIGLPEQNIQELSYVPYPPLSRTEQRLYIMLINVDKKELLEKELPELVIEEFKFSRSDLESKSIHNVSSEYKIKNFEGSYSYKKIEIKGSIDPQFTKRDFTIKDSVKKQNISSKLTKWVRRLFPKE